MTHPLTDEIMDKISVDGPGYSNPYDEDDMRAAADWQLEQVIEWIEEIGYEYVCYDNNLETQSDFGRMITDLKKAMRPQQKEL